MGTNRLIKCVIIVVSLMVLFVLYLGVKQNVTEVNGSSESSHMQTFSKSSCCGNNYAKLASSSDKIISEGSEYAKNLWGIWEICELETTSVMYNDSNSGGLDGPDNYMGCTVEYREDSITFDGKVYINPKYEISEMTIEEYNHFDGWFLNSKFLSTCDEKDIQIEGDKVAVVFVWLSDMDVSECDVNIPQVWDITVLNDDYILVGNWEKKNLAHKISD